MFPIRAFRRGFYFFAQNALPSLAQQVGALRQAEHVQNQRHFAVSHDGGPGVDGDVFQVLAERLDDDLFGVVDFVHHQPELPAIGFEHHDVDRLALLDFPFHLRQQLDNFPRGRPHLE